MSNSQGGHHISEVKTEPTEAELAQINVNTIAINNNASNITTLSNNITTNANSITTANNAINAVVAVNNTQNSNISSNTNAINAVVAVNNTQNSNITTANNAISSNDSDIATINTKIDMNASSAMKTAIDANSAKNSMVLGTSSSTALAGDTALLQLGTSSSTALAGNTALLQLGTSSSTALAGNTALLQLGTSSSTALAGDTRIITSQEISNISNNTTELGQLIVNTSQFIYPNGKLRMGATNNKMGIQHYDLNISNSYTINETIASMIVETDGTLNLNAPTSQDIKYKINNVEQMRIESGLVNVANGGDMTFKITAPNANTSKLFVGGDGTQGTSYISWGQANSFGIATYGGGIIYNGDDTPNISAPQDATTFTNYSGGTESNVMSYYFNDDFLKMYRSVYNVNYKEDYYGAYAEPRLIGQTMISSNSMTAHRMSYNGSTATNNVWYMPHPSFRVVCRTPPSVSKAMYEISFTTDGYYSGRNVYVCLSTTNSPNQIIPATITLIHGRNSDWTTRIHTARLIDTTLNANSPNIRYIFVKEVAVASNGSISNAGGNQGWVLFGGRTTHNGTTATQNTHYYESGLLGSSPFGATQPLIARCFSIPSNVATTSSTVYPFQFIGF